MADGPPLSILLVCSEAVGFAKTGGLADVCGYLPRALARRGHRCAVIMPLYRSVRNGPNAIQPTDHTLSIPIRHQTLNARLWKSRLPDSEVDVFLVENHELFERDDPAKGLGLYQMTLPDGRKQDYPDNCGRFVVFCRAVLEAIPHIGFVPDILHCNDWQTGLVPVYLRELYQQRPEYGAARCLFTIHNIAYQGVFKSYEFALTGLSWRLFNHFQLEFYGQLNFLKSGIVFADWISTVSPTYAQEIRTTYFGYGLEGVLTERRQRLSGIVNGVDYGAWNPATDLHLPVRYDIDSVGEGKASCKADLQRHFGLDEEPRQPLIGMIARLVEQKGVDIVLKAAEDILKLGAQLVILGDGDSEYHVKLTALRQSHPRQVGLLLGFDETLAHRIEAGADLYLMPSMFEPSGLNQLYSLKYGTPPIVRATGGLADTITDASEENLAAGTATGFRFVAYTPHALLAAVQRAVDLYNHRPEQFLQIVRTGMRQDWSWDHSAVEYEHLYRRLMHERAQKPMAGRVLERH